MRKVLVFILIIWCQTTLAQFKTDVLVIGGSASGTAAALQAARSGVKSILVESSSMLIGETIPDMDVPAFELGIWKEWKDSCKKDIDLKQLDPRIKLEKIISKEKNLKYFKEAQILKIKKNKNSWEVTIKRGGKEERIKTTVLVDAFFDSKNSPLLNSGILSLKDGYAETLVTYTPESKEKPYDVTAKLYRTSGAAAYGKDSVLHFFPQGAFISKEHTNLLIANGSAGLKGFESNSFKSLPLWINVGQMVGALAAYAPFFETTVEKANIRTIQGEIINFKSFLYPVKDVDVTDKTWHAVQKIIAAQLLRLDFVTGKFRPNEPVLSNDIKTILSEIHPRSRIWFIENKVDQLTIKETLSLISFIGGKELFDLEREVSTGWKDKYSFESDYKEEKLISRKEFSVLIDSYLSPFNIRVNMSGYFLK